MKLLRPKMPKLRTFAQAAAAVDELMATVADLGGELNTCHAWNIERAS